LPIGKIGSEVKKEKKFGGVEEGGGGGEKKGGKDAYHLVFLDWVI